ncbi:MAG: CvpA family protein [Tatlockia sp.]|jgi:membrane protein required for colicin V production
MHWVDLSILAVIALSVLTGLFRGFIKELIAICIWIAAIWIAFQYSEALEPFLQSTIHDKTALKISAFILVMLAILISGGIANALLGFIIKRSGLSGMDRLLGMGFGFVRGVFIVALIMLVINVTSLPHEQYSRESQLYAKFDPLVSWLYASTPEFIKQGKLFEAKLSSPTEKPVNQASALDLSTDFELSDA